MAGQRVTVKHVDMAATDWIQENWVQYMRYINSVVKSLDTTKRKDAICTECWCL